MPTRKTGKPPIALQAGSRGAGMLAADAAGHPYSVPFTEAVDLLGAGDVHGPGSSTDGDLAVFNGATGKILKDPGIKSADVPSDDQKAALAGTSGTPSATNKYVTDSDARLTVVGGITQLTGDVTAGPGCGSVVGAGTGDPTDLTATQATAILDVVVGDTGAGGTKGLVTAPGSGDAAAGKFLKADATWAVPPSGSGTVTHTGALTAGQLLKGNASADITVGDLTGDVTTSGGMATTAKTALKTRAVGITIDGAGSVITTGVKGFVRVPFAGTIVSVTLLSTDPAAMAGSIVVDIWKDILANYPPTVADTITASAKPTLSSANNSEDTTLTGWTTSIAAGDVLGFKVDSVATLTRVSLELKVTV